MTEASDPGVSNTANLVRADGRSADELRTVTMSEACAGATEALPSIFPGSWINGDFYIWIGHQDDHRAWGQLVEARRALESPSAGLAEKTRRRRLVPDDDRAVSTILPLHHQAVTLPLLEIPP